MQPNFTSPLHPEPSPMQPQAPPAKKIRAEIDSVDAVRKRRYELDKLKAKQQMRAGQGRVTLKASGPPPPGAPIDRVRHSDIFPTVDKVAKTTRPPPQKSRLQAPPPRRLDQSFEKRGSPPARGLRGVSPARDPRGASHARGASPSTGPSPSRAKSAPPSRPPPPPGPPPAVKEAPDSTPSRGRGFSSRPPPMTPGSTNAPAPTKTPKPKPPPLSSAPPVSSNSTPPVVATPKGPPVLGIRVQTPPLQGVPPMSFAAQANGPPNTPRLPGSAPPTPIQPLPGSGPPTPTQQAASESAPPTPLLPAAPMMSAPPSFMAVPAPAPASVADLEKTVQELPSPINSADTSKLDLLPPPTVPPAAQASVPMQEPAAPPNQPTVAVAPTTARQSLIRNMHEFAETPSKPAVPPEQQESAKADSSLLRLEKEVREHEKAKADALRRVVELEEEVQKLKEQGAIAHLPTETPKASTGHVGFFSPLSPGLATPRTNAHKRKATPHPKKAGGAPTNEEDSKSAVLYAPHEFTTELATFIVRRPYGMASERELWFQAGYLNSKQYEKTADVNKPETLEIVAQIGADGSTLALHGSSFVRHRTADDDTDFKEFGNADELDQPLGSVTYIDSDASEKDYSLDDVFRGVESARENYCTSVVSMGVGLKAKAESTRGKKSAATGPPATVAPVVKKETVEIGVGTEDLPFPDPAAAPAASPANDGQPEKGHPQVQQSPPGFDEDEGSDTISIFVGAFGSLLLWILKTILITFPLSVLSFVLALFLFFAAASLISLQFADDSGAFAMGAGIDTMFNRRGIV